jgi:hypothetical protein
VRGSLGDQDVDPRIAALQLHGERQAREAAAHHHDFIRSVLHHGTSKRKPFVGIAAEVRRTHPGGQNPAIGRSQIEKSRPEQ